MRYYQSDVYNPHLVAAVEMSVVEAQIRDQLVPADTATDPSFPCSLNQFQVLDS